MRAVLPEVLCCRLLLAICIIFDAGCVAWPDRPPPPEVAVVPPTGEQFATITVVRKKQFALSGAVFTIAIDGVPIANLEPGQYTHFHVSSDEHMLQVRWDIGGLNILGGGPGGGGYIRDPVHTYEKAIAIRCSVGATCFITIGAKAFAKHEEDRVILHQVDRLEGDFSLPGKTLVPPGMVQPK